MATKRMGEAGEDLVGAVLSLVQEGTAADSARRTLQFLSRVYRCSAAAAFTEQRGKLQLLSAYGVDQAGMDTVASTWMTSKRRLLAGERLQGPSGTIVPLMVGEEFAGLLFLRTTIPAPLPQFAPFLDFLAKLCRTPLANSLESLESMTATMPEDLERQQLLLLLEQAEWNLARVARAKGVTRPTIYNWMERLGIERKTVRQPQGYALRKKA